MSATRSNTVDRNTRLYQLQTAVDEVKRAANSTKFTIGEAEGIRLTILDLAGQLLATSGRFYSDLTDTTKP